MTRCSDALYDSLQLGNTSYRVEDDGDFTLNEVKELIIEVTRIAKESGCVLLLSDYREAVVKLSMLEIHELPKVFLGAFTSSGFDAHKLKRTLIMGKNLQDSLFYETVMINSGQRTSVFYDIDEARKWLTEK